MRRRPPDIRRYVPLLLALVVLGAGFFTVYQGLQLEGGLTQRILALSARFASPDGGLAAFAPGEPQDQTSDDEVYLPDIVSSSEQNSLEDSEPVEQADDVIPSAPANAVSSQGEQQAASKPPVPANKGTIIRENLNLKSTISALYLSFQNGIIKNSTKLSAGKIADYMEQDISFKIYHNDKPQVLIVHTHATESYEQSTEYFDKEYNSRSTNEAENIISVGNQIEKQLTAAGIITLHDKTLHDYPSYNGSYDRSAKTIKEYLKEYPSIKVVLDIHRDAIERDGSRLSAVATIDGKDAAQVMIISGCDDGTMDYPNWKSNLRFAARLQNEMETLYPGLTRPVMFCYRRYNQNLSTGSLLLEIGSHGNTLAEAQYTGELVGKSLVSLFEKYKGT